MRKRTGTQILMSVVACKYQSPTLLPICGSSALELVRLFDCQGRVLTLHTQKDQNVLSNSASLLYVESGGDPPLYGWPTQFCRCKPDLNSSIHLLLPLTRPSEL